jgi:hypothetical protein
MADKNELGALANAEQIIERFGGIRPMATKMDVPVTTVQGWKKRNVIPENRRDDVLRAAHLNNIELSDLIEKGGANENATDLPSGLSPSRPSIHDALRNFREEVRAATMDDDSEDGFGEEERADGVSDDFESIFSGDRDRDAAEAAEDEDDAQEMDRIAERMAAIMPGRPYPDPDAPKREPAAATERPAAPDIHAPILDAPVLPPRHTATIAETDKSDLTERLLAAERRATRKSVAASVLLLLVAGGLAGMLLAPQAINGISRLNAVEARQTVFDKQMEALAQSRSAAGAVPDDVQQKLSALQDQVTALAQKIQAGAGGAAPDTSALTQRLNAVEEKLGQLASSNGLTVLVGRLHGMQDSSEGQQELAAAARDLNGVVEKAGGNLNQSLVQAQQQPGALGDALKGIEPVALHQAALLIGLTELKSALDHSAPFDDDLSLMQNLLGDSLSPADKASFTQLSGAANQGVMTETALQDQLRQLAPAIVGASLGGQNAPLKDKAIARLNDLVQVSKGGELVSGTDGQAKMAQAQDALSHGDIQAALADIHGIGGAGATAAKPFVDNADMTLDAQKLAASLTDIVSGMLSIGGAPLTAGEAGLQSAPVNTTPVSTGNASDKASSASGGAQ